MKHIRMFENLSTEKQDFKEAINHLLNNEFRDIDPAEAEQIFMEFARYMKADAYRKEKNIGPAKAMFRK